MQIGDLVKCLILNQMGILVDFHWEDTEDEVYAVVQLFDNSTWRQNEEKNTSRRFSKTLERTWKDDHRHCDCRKVLPHR